MIARKIGYIGYIVGCQWFSRQHFGNTKSYKSYIIVIAADDRWLNILDEKFAGQLLHQPFHFEA